MADIPNKIDFGHYMALGMVWYDAKYSHGVWERFAHHFENSKNHKKSEAAVLQGIAAERRPAIVAKRLLKRSTAAWKLLPNRGQIKGLPQGGEIGTKK